MKRLATLTLLLLTLPAAGQDPYAASAQPYDAVVAGRLLAGCNVPPPASRQYLQWVFGGAGGGVTPGDVVAAAPNGRVLAAIQLDDAPEFELHFVEPDSSTPFAVSPPQYRPLSMAAARNGWFYVLAATVPQDQRAILTFNAAGGLVAVHPLPGTPQAVAIDLAADQCTLWIAAGSRVSRYDVCTSTLLSDFLVAPSVSGVRILPDGGALVIQSGVLRRYNAAGVQTQSYPLAEDRLVDAIGLADGGSTVLAAIGCAEELLKIGVHDGSVTLLAEISLQGPNSVVARASWTAALGSAHLETVPTATDAVIGVLALVLAFAAFLRLR